VNQLIRPTLIVIAWSHLLVGLVAFFAPAWFFDYIGHFPPFNAHYIADIGAFYLPLGVGLLIAARDPQRQRAIIGLAALGNLMHSVSHLRDFHLHLPPHTTVAFGLTQEALILLIGLILLAVWMRLGRTTPARQRGQQPARAG
jgi:hypothetical protein